MNELQNERPTRRKTSQKGLERQGLGERIKQVIETEISFPAVGQGALAVECREDDKRIKEIVRAINDQTTSLCCEAERNLLRSLEGGCQVPIAVLSQIDRPSDDVSDRLNLLLRGRVLSLDGKEMIEAQSVVSVVCDAPKTRKEEEDNEDNGDGLLLFVDAESEERAINQARDLGATIARNLLENGAKTILDQVLLFNSPPAVSSSSSSSLEAN